MRAKRLFLRCMVALVLVVPACSAQPSGVQPTTNAPSTTTTVGSDAANGYEYGSGTYYVASRRKVPPNWGDARYWYDRAQQSGYAVGDAPRKGAIAWTDRGTNGQVAIVEDVTIDYALVIITEMDGQSGWNRVASRTAPAITFKYIY